ncbi:hypothetical protein RFI_02346, partial [Reticulomyxa filosa]
MQFGKRNSFFGFWILFAINNKNYCFISLTKSSLSKTFLLQRNPTCFFLETVDNDAKGIEIKPFEVRNLCFHFFFCNKKKTTIGELIGILHIHLQHYSKGKCNGGMQDSNTHEVAKEEEDRKYAKEIKILIRLFGDSIQKEDLQKKIIYYNGNIEMVIKDLVQQFVEKESKETESKANELENTEQKQDQENALNETNDNTKNVQKEMEKTEIGETKPGINLQGYCINQICLAAKVKLPVWVNIGFHNTTFVSDKTSFSCPDCKKTT